MKEFLEYYTIVDFFFICLALVCVSRPRDIIIIPLAVYILPLAVIALAPFLIIADLFGLLGDFK